MRLILAIWLLVFAAVPVLADAIDDARAALVAQDNDELDEAIRLYTRAIQSRELNNRFLSIAYYNRGSVHFVARDYRAAITDFDSATVIRPGYAQAYNNMGNVYVALDAYQQAVVAYDEAILVRPDYALAYSNRGNAHTGAGFYQRAMADYDLAIGLAPDFAKAYKNRANAKYFLGRYAAAMVDYEAALEIDPFDTYSMMWRYLAALRNRDDPAEAREALRSGLRDVDAGRWPAVIARHLAGRATAQEVLAEIDSGDSATRVERQCEAYFYLASARLIAGDRQAAARLYQDSIATDVKRFIEYIGATIDLERLDQ
jgi:lipoprotein NlpI